MEEKIESRAKIENLLPTTKMLYICLLFSLLMLFLFYFDMIDNSRIIDIAEVLVGFLLILVIQLKFISYHFGNKMKELNLDEFGMVKELVKNHVFGEINIDYINRKNKEKYYTHTKKKTDALFNEENLDTYQCLMGKLRTRSEINHNERIRGLRDKWEVLLIKIELFQKFLNKLFKVYKDRATLFKTFYQKNIVEKINEGQYEKWCVLFAPQDRLQIDPRALNSYLEGYDVNIVDWGQMNYLISQRMKMNDSKTKEIANTVLKQFKVYADEMRNHRQQKINKLQTFDNEYTYIKRNYREICDQIAEKKMAMEQIAAKIKQGKIKSNDNMETLFNNEYELKLTGVLLQNLEVKKTYERDICLKKSQDFFRACHDENEWLQKYAFKSFDNKIFNYLEVMFSEERSMHEKLTEHKADNKISRENDIFDQISDQNSCEFTIEKFNELERRGKTFNSYLIELMTLHRQLIANLSKTNEIIDEYEKNLSDKLRNSDSLSSKGNDNMFIKIIQKICAKETSTVQSSLSNLQKQLVTFRACEETNKKSKNQIVSAIDKIKKVREAYYKEKKKKGNTANRITNEEEEREIAYLSNEFKKQLLESYWSLRENKILSFLYDVLESLLKGQYEIYKHIEAKKEHIEYKLQDYEEEDPREYRMNQYFDEIFKNEMLEKRETNFKQDKKEEEKRQGDEQSMEVINKLLGVFFEEWSNSTLFHEIIKEQLEISLNRKRPDIVSHISFKYLKIQEKYGHAIQSVNVLGDLDFCCLFELYVNFKGKIAVQIETEIKGKKIPIIIKLMITQFKCPIKVCFTPFSLGKSYGSLMKIPQLTVELNVTIGGWSLTKIPFITKIIKTIIVIKLRKKLLHPKRFTLSVPMAVKNTIDMAIRERNLYEKEQLKKDKMM